MKPVKMAGNTGSRTTVWPEALPRFYPGGSRGVLLIHGFSGNPEEMDFLGRELNKKGYTVSIPRLPGHGTGKSDFRNSGREQWLRCSLDAYLDLKTRLGEGGRTDIIGLSMGGLLAMILAAAYRPEKLVLAAPALKISNPLFPLTPLLKFFIREQPKNRPDNVSDERYSDPEAGYYYRTTPTAQAAELYRLQREALSVLPRISSACLTVLSRADRTVPPEVLSLLEKKGGFSRLENQILESSGHVVVNGSEKEAAASRILQFLEE